ncbi:hypothetical protein H0H81_002934 [Sphagnurus paluster]|uniref:Csf1 N-terminal domain-containing protein n=1 Tax=Sphagnurus paluster TaxID=117069 RepID=A0A9P7G2M4_9AGAR|nr:hypothetical protein H0H81_002934 [Sphagnurus paluster]
MKLGFSEAEKIVRRIFNSFLRWLIETQSGRRVHCNAEFKYLSKGLNGFSTIERRLMTVSSRKWRPPIILVAQFHGTQLEGNPLNHLGQESFYIPYGARKIATWIKRQLPSLDPKDLLPLGIEITKGAITCGNNSTPNLLVAEFQRSEGTFGVVEARSKFDLYKQLFSMKFQNTVVRYVENESYADPMTSMGELVHARIVQYSMLGSPLSYLSYRPFVKLWNRLGLLALARKYTLDRRDIHAMQRQRATRPKTKIHKTPDEATPVVADFSEIEYAVERRILETPLMELSYYFDIAGEVPSPSDLSDNVGIESADIGNGDMPPEWGIDIMISGGIVRYGPWADRQRAELQKTFFPPTYQNSEITNPLKPGDKRLWTAMRIFVELRENTALYIPFREPSKDWQWDGKANVPQKQRIREAAAIHVTVHCELPTPVKWNAERKWIIAVTLRQPVLYLLRDHINMFIDLGKDWTTGPPTDYQRFIPMVYTFELELHHFELNLYANDHNIIDKPLIRDENALFTLRGNIFNTSTDILSNKYRPENTIIPFLLEIPDASLSLSLPRWNTNAMHAPKDGNSLANVRLFRIEGSYEYYAEVREDYVEQLKLNILLRDITFKSLGWSIRYFMVLRDNYLGSFTHFSTLSEYLEKRKKNLPLGDPILSKYRPGKSNMMDTEIQLFVEHGTIVLPAGLPGYSSIHNTNSANTGIGECLLVAVPDLQLQFRMHDHYMEMSLNIGSITGGLVSNYPEKITYRNSILHGVKKILQMDGIDITANRLFGPQPRTATYICIWEINFGPIKSLLSASEGRLLVGVGNAFRLNFADFPNAPAMEHLPPIDPDVTFVKLFIKALDLTWKAGDAALSISLPKGIKVDSNDLGGRYHRKTTGVKVPEISAKVLLASLLRGGRWLETLDFTADAYLDIYSAPRGFRDTAQAQIAYVEEQDRLTDRAQAVLNVLVALLSLEIQQGGIEVENRGRVRSNIPNQMQKNGYQKQITAKLESDELDRKTRSSTPGPQFANNENQNMSSGDESDDEDLTDASSESSWSDIAGDFFPMLCIVFFIYFLFVGEDGLTHDKDPTTLRNYTYVTRHYVGRFLESLELWDGCPFILVRDCTLLDATRGQSGGLSFEETTKPKKPDSPIVLNDSQGFTIFRFKSKRPITVKITPLVLPAAIRFEEDMRRNPLGPELCLDAIMAGHLSAMSGLGTSQSPTLFEAYIRSVTVHVIQRIIMTDGHPTISRNPSQVADSSVLDVIAIIRGNLTGITASVTLANGKPVTNIGTSQLSISLETSIDKRTIQPASPHDCIFSYDFYNLEACIAQDSLSFLLTDSTIRIGQLGPEYMVSTGIALTQTVRELIALVGKWRMSYSSLEQTTVSHVIRCSSQKGTVDSLSTIQPSYLVQSGTPHALRTDTVFRFFYHLRSCLWHLETNERDLFRSLQETTRPVELEELLSLLRTRIDALDPDPDSANRSLLEPFYSILHIQSPTPASSNVASSSKSISVQLTKTSIIVLDTPYTSPSELVVTDVYLSARMFMGDIIQVPLPANMSQTSLREKACQKVSKTSLSVFLGDFTLSIFPHLMGFAQQALRVRRHYYSAPSSKKPSKSSSVRNYPGLSQLLSSDIIFSLRHLQVQAAAENLVFELGLSGVRGTSSLLLLARTIEGQSMNHSILFDQIYVRARSPSDMAKQKEQDILASLELTLGKFNAISRKEPISKTKHRLVFDVSGLRFHVPRSALRLYRFVQEWRADFLPGIEATVQALLSEMQKAPLKPTSPQVQRSSSRRLNFQLQGQISHVCISLQVMHGTWLSWEADNIISYINSSNPTAPDHTFGLRIDCVTISVSSKANARQAEPSTRVQLVLPPVSATGRYDGSSVHTIALMEFIELKVKPSHWDTLLIVQQKFGQDFHDLVTLVQETNLRQAASKTPKAPKNSKPLKYSGFLKVQGFRVGLEGPSTMYLECLDIGGGVHNSNGLAWNIELSDLALSLAPRAVARPNNPGFNRNHRSAFVIINFKVEAANQAPGGITSTAVQILVTKIHAVMQPSSIGEVGDFVDHLQAEMLRRKEQRALELLAFKEKTDRILKTFESSIRDMQPEERPSLENYIINVSIQNIGAAFPLTHDQDLQLPITGSRDSTAVPAFLWSIKSIEFGTHRGETGQAGMKSFSFQFVSRFRQSIPSDFAGESHQTRNRLVYPEMEAQLRSVHSGGSRHIWVGANVSGFILDLDSNIPSYVFSLIDVYRQGKDRMTRLSSSLPRTPSVIESESDTSHELKLEAVPSLPSTSNLFGSLKFLSGKVRVYNGAAAKAYRTKAFPHHQQEPSDEQVMDIGGEVFNLPVVSLWAEYRATPVSQIGATHEPEPSILMFKSTVHSSQNILRPTLLPFLTELVSHIETRLRRVSLQTTRPVSAVIPDISVAAQEQETLESVTSMRISFSLRIDQSKLELTCQPDVNVIAGLHWDSGGFIINVSPGARKVTFTGSVGGLTLGLKHGFLSEDCVMLDARNLAFSVTFAKVVERGMLTSVSVVFDTEFFGVVRFSRLQDILCFKAVWLDRIPIFNSQAAMVAKTSAETIPSISQPKQRFATAILVRIRQITLDVDLGQSISAMTLDLKDAVLRTKLTDLLSELSVFVTDIVINAKGNVAGHAHVPQCVFQSIRSTATSNNGGLSRMLELSMTSGPLVVLLESDHQKLLHYRAEPLEVKIFDDWSTVSLHDVDADKKPLQLSFTVMSPEIVAAVTVGTIPKLLTYVNKFKANLDAQRLGASRESKTFRVTRTPKPDNPLSAVAEAMLQSARSRFEEAETGLSYIIKQHMSLQLDSFRLVVFPRTMDDLEIAQFVGRDVRARLDRLVESEPNSGTRDLLLSFSSMTISKFSGLGNPQTSDPSDSREWLVSLVHDAPQAIIVGLPSMTMHMVSEMKEDEDLATVLVYDFHSEFVRREGNREFKDIFITLNVSLYSWLTILRKNFTREMEQVKAATDWRALLNKDSSQGGALRKKVPDALNLHPSSPRSSTIPILSPTSRLFSPLSPTGGPPTASPSPNNSASPGTQNFPSMETPVPKVTIRSGIVYQPRSRHIERLTMRQLGEATPDVMHPFFMKKAGFNLEDSLPQYVNEYATAPLEEIMEILLKLYSRQLLSGHQ